MSRGKSKNRKPNYLKTVVEARGLNPASLARYIRERFGQPAKAADGREALLERVVHLHQVQRRPLAAEEEPPAAPPASAAPAPSAPPAPPEGSAAVADAGAQFADAILDRLGAKTGPKKDPPPPLEPNERWEGDSRVTDVGDFSEAAQYPTLKNYRRERDHRDLTFFRGPNGKRVMLGKIVEIFDKEGYRGAAPAGVNGMVIGVPRQKRCGVPIPHFEQLLASFEAHPVYGKEHDVPLGSHEVPPAPPPPMIGKRPTYPMGVYGDCLCDPDTLEVVVELTQIVSTMRSIPAESMELNGSAL